MRFLGRDDELRTLLDVVTGAEVGLPVGMLVEGDAGIGKSRLLAEFARELTAVTFAWGHCSADDTRHAFSPWLQVLSHLCLRVPPATLTPPLAGATELQSLLGIGAIETGSYESARHFQSAAVAEYLERYAREVGRPLIVLLDDLHLADLPSLRLLAFLTERPLDAPIGFVATLRPISAQDLRRPVVDALTRSLERMLLTGLTRAATRGLLRDAGVDCTESEFEALWELSRGNPLFVQESIRQMSAGVPPPALTNLFDARLAALGNPVLALLRMAAVAGDPFDLALVALADGVELETAVELLQEAAHQQLVVPSERGIARYQFVHGAYQERLLGRMDALERARLHHRVLNAIETLRDDDPRYLSQRARHAVASIPIGNPADAVSISRRAGDQALGRIAPEVAIDHYRSGLALIEAFGDDRRDELDIRLGLGVALSNAAEPDARRALADVMRLAEERDAPHVFGTAVLFLPTNVGIIGQAPWGDEHAEKALRHAIRILAPEPSVLRVRLLCELAHVTYNQSTHDDVAALCDEAVGLAHQLGDPECSAWAGVTDHLVRRGTRRATVRLAAADAAASIAGREIFDLRLAAEGLAVTALMAEGRFADAQRRVSALEAAFPSLPPLARWSALRWKAACSIARGRFEVADQLMTEAMNAAVGTRHEGIAKLSLGIQAFTLARERGQLADFEPMVRQWVDEHPQVLGFRASLAFLLADLGALEAARHELDAMFETDLRELRPYAADYVPMLALAANVAGRLQDPDRAQVCLDLLAPYVDDFLVIGAGTAVPGPIAMFAATAARSLGRIDDAVDLGARAIRSARWAGALPALRHSELELLHALAARQGSDDAQAAQKLAAEAAAGYRELDMGSFADVADAIGADVGAPPRSRPGPSDGLSSDEGRFVRSGSRWEITLGSESAVLMDIKGLAMLAVLLQRPDVEIHVLELSAAVDGRAVAKPSAEPGELSVGNAADPVLDERALAAYRQRIEDLESVIDESERDADLERGARAREELDFLLEELTRSTGLGGRSRSNDRTVERARVRVTKAIKMAVAKIGDDAPELGFHLDAFVHTGVFCRYAPPQRSRPTWHF